MISTHIVNPNYPFIGASPDAIVECKCCGISCLEIKCPYSHRGDSIPKMLGKKSYLHKNAEGKVQLMSNHFYHYQVQTQILVTGFKFCDFFVRAEKDTFCNVLLPEHIGRYFTD